MRTDQELLVEQRRLQQEAVVVRADLALDERFSEVGVVTLVGSAALGLMVWRDLDLTVVDDFAAWLADRVDPGVGG